jgi:murein DD-endopeptidase MepM/ murein hydrolase activator NlpD
MPDSPSQQACARFAVCLITFSCAALGSADAVLAQDSEGGARHSRSALGPVGADHDDSYSYRLPYGDGVSFSVLQAYGSRLSHRGSEYFTVDFQMEEGTPVLSAREGTVIALEDGFSDACWVENCGQLANFVVVLHADGTTGEYFHLQAGSVVVQSGQFVARGTLLARSGNTGYSTTPHLHFGVYRAAKDGRSQSVAVRFRTRDASAVELRAGGRYLNATDGTAEAAR